MNVNSKFVANEGNCASHKNGTVVDREGVVAVENMTDQHARSTILFFGSGGIRGELWEHNIKFCALRCGHCWFHFLQRMHHKDAITQLTVLLVTVSSKDTDMKSLLNNSLESYDAKKRKRKR